jgi:ABC-type nitrate/sulfonate/bicarbonate transport system substrate-binding protein
MANDLALSMSPKTKALRAIAKGLTKAAMWAVQHPETIIQIVRQIKAEEAAKSTRVVIKPR